ncbi:hypothetical protein [Modestobacter versicolor]|uniref:hypothetical protein n=1 Tax=Modestobacter versicolor TaxID=429133 RepID=UPI0034DEE644
MSTPSTEPTPAVEPEPTTGATTGATTTDVTHSASEGTLANVEATDTEPGWVARHTATLIALMVAVIVAAVAIAGVMVYKNNEDSANSDTEAAFAATVQEQGASLETVECNGGTCAAVINGQAYTVLVQEDDNGDQHFGVSPYTGD